ncbi:MAG: hypothetical protein K9J79_08715 [Desulfobacteraceae bacterium]|nr:hypothetical protein [Desulfobacteraceae bacterium]
MTRSPAPEKKSLEIIEALNEMAKSETVDNIALARYKREAEQFKNTGLFRDAFIILGMIACLEDDFEKMHNSHINAIHYAPDDPASYSNYGVSLIKAGMPEEAYKYFVKTCKIEPTNKKFLNDVIEILYDLSIDNSKYEEELEYYAARWKELTGENHELYDDPDTTAKLIDACDNMINEDHDAVSDIDPKVWNLAKRLTEGVELGK